MAFPASTATLSEGWINACRMALAMKRQAQEDRARMAAGPVPASLVLDMEPRLRDTKASLQQVAAIPGIAEYAQQQANNPALNVATEFTAMLNALDNVVAWIRTNYPVHNGYLLSQTFGATGRQDRTFSAAETAGLRTVLDALIASVG